MSTTIPDSKREELRKMAMQIDSEGDTDTAVIDEQTPEEADSSTDQTEQDIDLDADNGDSNENQQQTSKSDPVPKESAKPKDKNEVNKSDPTESKYAKAKKDKERYDSNWKKFEEEKKVVREREAQIADRERRLQERERSLSQPKAQPKDDFSSEQYERAAQAFEKEGKFDMAELAREKAIELKSKPTPQASPELERQNFSQQWVANEQWIAQKDPDFYKMESPIAKKVQEFLKRPDNTNFARHPDGIVGAYYAAKSELLEETVSGLHKELENLKQEKDRLSKINSLGGSNPTPAARKKAFNELSNDERKAELRRYAEEADKNF